MDITKGFKEFTIFVILSKSKKGRVIFLGRPNFIGDADVFTKGASSINDVVISLVKFVNSNGGIKGKSGLDDGRGSTVDGASWVSKVFH